MDDDSLLPGEIFYSFFHANKAFRGMWIWRGITFKIAHGLDGRFHFNTMLLVRVLGNITPFSSPALCAYPFFLIDQVNDDRVVSHLQGKVSIAFTPRIESFSHPAIHNPLEMRH